MKKSIYALFFVALFVGGFIGGAVVSHRASNSRQEAGGERRVLYYVDPMNPSHTSKEPGFAPCGMALEPVYADDEFPGGEGTVDLVALPPGTVRISPTRQQMIGVRIAVAETSSASHALRTLGRVAADENRTHRILAAEDGWMWDVHESTTGSVIHKDQILASLYNYLFLARQQQYLYALDLADRKAQTVAMRSRTSSPAPETDHVHGQQQGERDMQSHSGEKTTSPGTPSAPQTTAQLAMTQQGAPSRFNVPLASYSMVQTTTGGVNPAEGVYYLNDPLELAKLELYNLGVGEYQMDQIARVRKVSKDLEVRSPVTGIVLSRNVSPMQKFQKGAELFRIADITRVWIYADVYWREANRIVPGMRARVSLPERDTVFEARVSDVPAQFDPASKALRVRIEADNPDLDLRPDMVVDVDFLLELPASLNVPADAVIDSGAARTVFVSLGDGFFQPRSVKTGWRFGDRVEIREGLMPGEQIVVSGNFLINSESRMKLAAAGFIGGTAPDPSCEVPMAPTSEAPTAHSGASSPAPPPAGAQTSPGTTPGMAMPPREAAPAARPAATTVPGISRCPVCGMIVYEGKARASGLTRDHAGKTHFFCSSHCRDQFSASPERYLPKEANTPTRNTPSTPTGPASHD